MNNQEKAEKVAAYLKRPASDIELIRSYLAVEPRERPLPQENILLIEIALEVLGLE